MKPVEAIYDMDKQKLWKYKKEFRNIYGMLILNPNSTDIVNAEVLKVEIYPNDKKMCIYLNSRQGS